MDSNILMLSSGLHTSIQDLGRKGMRSFGVPIAGAMDKFSAILANKLLNNAEGLPVMEMTLSGPKILFEDHTLFVITGADMSPELNGVPIQLNVVYTATISDVLSFGKLIYGSRSYLGVKGGFLTENKLNSYSYYKGITACSTIKKGTRLQIANYSEEIKAPTSKIKVSGSHFKTNKIEVTKGPEFYRLTKKQKELLFSKDFKIDILNDRMGYQLTEQIPPLEKHEIITSITIPGTVQLTPSGKLIIFMRDCPTTGGYPRIFQLTDLAINQLAQKKTGDIFKFELESSFSFLSRLVSKIRS